MGSVPYCNGNAKEKMGIMAVDDGVHTVAETDLFLLLLSQCERAVSSRPVHTVQFESATYFFLQLAVWELS